MKFGFDKCKISSIEKGKWIQYSGYGVSKDQGTIEEMGEEEKYKRLDYLQSRGIDHRINEISSIGDSDIDELNVSDDEDRNPNFVDEYDSISEIEHNCEQKIEEDEYELLENEEEKGDEPTRKRNKVEGGNQKQYVEKSGPIWSCEHQVYTGKPPGGQPKKNQGFRVVCDLVSSLFGIGRGVTTDNFLPSTSLAEFLLLKNMTLLGTVRKNKLDTPKELNVTKGREVYSSEFVFSEQITMHADSSIVEDESKKPHIILHYNATKGAVDNADKLICEYTCAHRIARWPFGLFMNLIVCSIE
ncbi:hypothetical protein NQ314_018650 [Rhamnusium bicolor]|uniref:PiggyBac transposable element-derived protein domain-containing protein n=1 Tax=Rhamnusium bicolor TaxID=1586634 RepID=A0AAV8WQK8_9CUCU|nr:hypothetical protein NQ314_018650 [Rhamnusium bicolor]